MNLQALNAFREFKPRPVDAWMFDMPDVRAQLELQIAHFPSIVLPSIEKPSVFAGIVHAHGKGELWMVTGEGFERDAPIVMQQARQICATMVEVLNLRRLHMFVDSDRADAKLWAKRLGFWFEAGPLKHFGIRGNDQDVFIFKPNERKQSCQR